MVLLLSLPTEVLRMICDHAEARQLASLARTCQPLYSIANPMQYRRAKDNPEVLCWAAEKGLLGTMQQLLAAGADPNKPVQQDMGAFDSPALLGRPQDYLRVLQNSLQRNPNIPSTTVQRAVAIQAGRAPPRPKRIYTALHQSARAGHDHLVTLLLCNGANINTTSSGFCECCPTLTPELGYPTMAGRFSSRPPESPMWTPLHVAICKGHQSTAKLLMSWGASLVVGTSKDPRTGRPVTALHCSSVLGDVALTQAVMEHYQPDLEARTSSGLTALGLAYQYPYLDVMELLLKNGARVDEYNGDGTTLLGRACKVGQYELAAWLIERGANPLLGATGHRFTPLHLVCESISREPYKVPADWPRLLTQGDIASILLKAGPDAIRMTTPNQTVPILAAAKNCSHELVELLIAHGADANAYDKHETALTAACGSKLCGRTPEDLWNTVRLLITHGASVHRMDIHSHTPLEILCRNQPLAFHRETKEKLVELLIQHGATPEASDPSSQADSPCISLFVNDHIASCRLLLAHGATPPNPSQISQMIAHAITRNKPEALRFVLAFDGAPKLMATETRLYEALKKDIGTVAEILFDHGAPYSYVSDEGWSCLLLACQLTHDGLNLCRKLLLAGADPNHLTDSGVCPLDIAVQRNDSALVELLLDQGADPDHAGPDGRSVLVRASNGPQQDIVNALLRSFQKRKK
ncbi:uncharacterized protein JN550_009446 [Neoarthrinium moseri]|uniref:uncharacterized protein n=1 Tax=Neoarthrinium moseri TaxID=1658444 RepID=UPI001FDDB2DF|nr:uncharacterized protein JN550_009446 [Neoarthrinium moseri]KAI1863746.1 hypothetical protein JN550_009446 [Neoarthrinium moseri]